MLQDLQTSEIRILKQRKRKRVRFQYKEGLSLEINSVLLSEDQDWKSKKIEF